MRELIEQRMLSRTGYQYRYQPVRFYLPQKVERTGHNRRYTFGNKVLALAGIYHLLLVLVGIATVSTIENQIDGRCARTTLIHKKFFGRTCYSQRRNRFVPSIGMKRHRVVKDTVHIDKNGFQIDIPETRFCK